MTAHLPTFSYARWRARRWLRATARAPRTLWHELRWSISSPDAIAHWTDRRLQVGDAYWLFVLGLNNSGTSLLSHVLSEHPRIRSLPSAGQGLTAAVQTARQAGVSRLWTERPDLFRWTEDSDSAPARRMRYDWARFYPPRPGILLEKSPPNTMRSRWLQRHFHPSRFVAIVRSPYAVCEGMRRREGIPIQEAAEHWRRGHEYLLEDLPKLERALVLSYEAFTERPDQELRRLEAFLDLDVPFDRALLDRPMPSHNAVGRPQPIGNLNEGSHGRLSEADRALIGEIAGPLIARMGDEPL